MDLPLLPDARARATSCADVRLRDLARTFGCVRFVWNWALRARTDAFRAGERMGYPATDRALTLLKQQPETVWLNEVSSVCPQQALRGLPVAFSNFFAKRAAYPTFKRKEARQSANYTERGFSFDAERVSNPKPA